MRIQMLFSVVFLSQVLLISLFLPRQILGRVRHVVRTYPPSRYPKLYPVSIERVEKTQRAYLLMNGVALAVGSVLFVGGLVRPGNELFNGDNDLVFMFFVLLQFFPMVFMAKSAGFVYFNPERNLDSSSTRKAHLTPRRVFDFVPPALLGVAVVAYLGFAALIAYIRQFDFPWFGGYANLVGITAVNLFFAVILFRLMYGKREDPYQAYEDRARQLAREARLLLSVSIAATVFLALSISLRTVDLHDFTPLSQSLYLQLIALMALRAFRTDDVNFEVYREDPVAT